MESSMFLLPTLGFIPSLDVIWEVDETMEEAERQDGDGQFLCWGCGEFGQHCHGDQCDVSFTDSHVTQFDGYTKVKYVGCGSSHNVVITETDEIFVWGNGNSGQLGCKTVGTKWEPSLIHLTSSDQRTARIDGVSCGGRHTMIWLENGHVYSFGNNFYAQLGYDFKVNNYKANQLEPKLLKFLVYRHVIQVCCGDKHSLFLFSDGSVAAMGNNTHGQIGNDSRGESVVPCSIDIDKPVTYIASGANHNLAITEDGDVYMWGYSRGCGHRRHDVLIPQKVLQGHHVVQVAGGGTHSMALTANGNVYTWGGGMDGQLGHDKTAFLSRPHKVKDCQLSGQVVYIACGESFSAAVTGEGKLYMWGKSSHTIVAGEKSTYKVYQPTCLNETSNIPVESVYCGAWHAAALTGKNKRVLTEEDSESELSDEDGTVSITSQATLGEDSPFKNEFGESELVWELSEMEIPVPPVSTKESREQIQEANTRLTLGEFYAPTPDLSTKVNTSVSNPSVSSGSVADRSHDPEVTKRLVVQMPVSHVDQDISSNSTPSRSISRESPKGEETLLDQHNDHCYIPDSVFHGAVPPHATQHIDVKKQTARTDVPKLHLGYNRSKTMAFDNGHHTVQISKHIADKYTLPRENTKLLLSKNVTFVNASDLKTTGPLYSENVSPTRTEDVPNCDVHAVTIEKQKQHLTAVLKQLPPQDIVVQSTGQENTVHRSKTLFAPLPGQMTRGNTRFFYKRKPSLNQLANRNAQARAQLLNPKALERMATVGWGLGGPSTGVPQTKVDGPVTADPSKRKPVFSSASSWRERKDILLKEAQNKSVSIPDSVPGKSLVESKKDQLFKINSLRKELNIVTPKEAQSIGPVPVPGSMGKRNQLIKASSLTNIASVPKKTHVGSGDTGTVSASPPNQTHFPSVQLHSQGGCDDLTNHFGQTKVHTVDKLGMDNVGLDYRAKEVVSGVRTG